MERHGKYYHVRKVRTNGIDLQLQPTIPKEVVYHLSEEEIAYGPACYLWDYLRRFD